MATRRRAREVVLQMLFQLEANRDSAAQVVALDRDNFGEGPLPDAFSTELFCAVAKDIEEIDRIIVTASDNWRLERMSRVDRNILRMGVWEIEHPNDTPVRVVINEAVELAKRFGAEDSAAFVNGVLDRIAKERQKLD